MSIVARRACRYNERARRSYWVEVTSDVCEGEPGHLDETEESL